MIFQIYDLSAPLVAKASTVRYSAGKAKQRNPNMENRLPKNSQAPEKAVKESRCRSQQMKNMRYSILIFQI